ncbi:hypothetical protein NDU88_001771 [Pleurodeles waltl]|uniref:Uncharacterized protein n=1 Tax=Pleurodeles waltl TaxID=8319 RepID=A0AAV7W0F6_PLEWA|nr:hypothetical protein NDU88_001771 [Pleurodeles waltl]
MMVKPKSTKNLVPGTGAVAGLTAPTDQSTDVLGHLEATLHTYSAQFEMHAILGIETMLESKIHAVSLKVNLLLASHRKLAERVDDTESSLTAKQPMLQYLQGQLNSMRVQSTSLHQWEQEAERRMRRSNLCFLGFLEWSEGRAWNFSSKTG